MNRRTFTKSILTGIGAILSAKLLGNGTKVVEVEKVAINGSYIANPAKGFTITYPTSDVRNPVIMESSNGTPVFTVRYEG